MRIQIDIPDWVDGRDLYLVAGTELVAMKLDIEGYWKVKTERCNYCGQCCMNLPSGHYYPLKEDGSCSKLIPDGDKWVCSLGIERILPCIVGEPQMRVVHEWCCIRYNRAE